MRAVSIERLLSEMHQKLYSRNSIQLSNSRLTV